MDYEEDEDEDHSDLIYKDKIFNTSPQQKYVIEESMSIGHTDTEYDKDLK